MAIAASQPVVHYDGQVKVIEPQELAPSSVGEISVTILDRPLPGGPIQLELLAEQVGLPENRLGWDDVVDPQAEQPRLLARVVAPAVSGEYVVLGRLSYITCARTRCRPRLAAVQWLVRVL